MVTNIPVYLPQILLAHSKEGAIPSIILGLITGLVSIYVIIKLFSRYPGKGLPELMEEYAPKWLFYPLIFYFACLWFVAGLITLIRYTFLIITFLMPETSIYIILFSFLIILPYGVTMKSNSVLYLSEIILVLLLPVFIFILIKAYSSPEVNWDFAKVAIMHSNHLPNYSAYNASTFLFLGIANLIIFNRFFTKKLNFGYKHIIVVGIFGTIALITTYFLPIAFNGFEAIQYLNYPWISTSDSIRMKFGFIERLVFIFLTFYLAMSFLSISVHWHVSLQLFKSIFKFKKVKTKNTFSYVLLLIFIIIGTITTKMLTEQQLLKLSQVFFNSQPVLFLFLIISLVAVNRGARSS